MYKCAAIIVLKVLLFIPAGVSAQYSNKEIDSLINIVALQCRQDGKWKEGLEVYSTALRASRQNNYRKGIVESYMNMGNLYYMWSNSTASILYLDTALSELKGLENKALETRVLAEFGKNYFHFSQTEKSLQYFDQALKVAAEIKDEHTRTKNMHYIYAILASVYESNNQVSNFYNALEKAYASSPNPLVASRMARYFLLYNKNLDSARTYIEKANKMWETGSYPEHQRSIMLRNEGLYNYTINNYSKARELYNESLAISKKLGNKEEEKNTYKMLSELHAKMQNTKSKDSAIAKVESLRDTMEKDRAKAITIPLKDAVKESLQNEAKENDRSHLWWYIAAILLTIAIVGLASYYTLRKRGAGKPEKSVANL